MGERGKSGRKDWDCEDGREYCREGNKCSDEEGKSKIWKGGGR